MKSAKIIVTGPAHAGTTTLIRSLSEIAVLSTERRIGWAPARGREEATISLDFGRVTIDRDLVLYFFGTPGDDPASLALGPLAERPIGLIVTLDTTRPASVEGAAGIVEFLRTDSEVPYVVAANRLPQGDENGSTGIRGALHVPDDVPIVACEVTERESVKRVVLALIDRILDTMPTTADSGLLTEAE
jgi:signal recognition particle receptor subunit beta